ncbi:dephospho-CoA kinase [Pseudahrensia aquimaris]|uniref:Dephospho-CoA kinase n=1 Tax=Pseudahrensia aquimaris TaxID=744461 RepID=A0ABW3FKQ7_9HYPH
MQPLLLGLTGSIGMGKSTTAQMFRDAGVPVFDSDATVHALYEGEAVPLIEEAFPGTTKNGTVDRALLSSHVIGKEDAMKKLEAIVHPLVHREEMAFRERIGQEGHAIAIMDAPLLFERNNADKVDAIIVVSAPPEVQRERVLTRPGMNEEKFEAILARQVPDVEKRARADHIIDSSLGLDAAREAVAQLLHIYTPLEIDDHA